MSSPWFIAMESEDGTVKSIVVHSDGDLPDGGLILFEHYRGIVKTAALLDLGNLSVFGPEIGEQHTREEHYQGGWRWVGGDYRYMDEPPTSPAAQGWCFAYIRDWGRSAEEAGAITHESRVAFLEWCRLSDTEQVYLLTDKGWLYWPGDLFTPRKSCITAANMPPGMHLESALALAGIK